MVGTVTKGLNTTLNIVNLAAGVLDDKDTQRTVGRLGGSLSRVSKAGGAITSISAQTTILSRVFIDESIIDEPVIANIMRSNHEWYAAQIIAALHLSRMVDGQRTVQQVLSVVQTGHNKHNHSLIGNVVRRTFGQESFLTAYLGEAALESARFGPPIPADIVKDAISAKEKAEKDLTDLKAKESTTSVRSVAASENRIGPMGELYEIKLTNPNGSGHSVTIPLFIQMQPSIISADVAPRFIDLNVTPSVWQRWTQMQAGELSFWKDFILSRDLAKRQRSIIKDPKQAEVFSEFLKTVAKKDSYALSDVSSKSTHPQSQNLANSVVMFSEDTVARAKADSGIDLHNPKDRERYFRDTYTMIIVVIDPTFQRVTVYFNGIDGSIEAAYSDFRPKDTKFDPKDFMVALQAFSSNNIGRLR